jgi:RNA polymerase sigma-70 factor (ECF subfamily)
MNREPSENTGAASLAGLDAMTAQRLAPPRADALVLPFDEKRFRTLVEEHLDFTWRSLRRLGLPPDVADDATQRVFLVVQRKLSSIVPGCERAFLFNAAVRVASSERRTFARRREVLTGDGLDDIRDAAVGAEERLDAERARTVLHELLQELEMDLRTVFVLFELEGLTTAEIGLTLGISRGTAASRLRRAREVFRLALKRRRAQLAPALRRT